MSPIPVEDGAETRPPLVPSRFALKEHAAGGRAEQTHMLSMLTGRYRGDKQSHYQRHCEPQDQDCYQDRHEASAPDWKGYIDASTRFALDVPDSLCTTG